MTRSSGSTVVRRRLGAALRALREEANIRIEAAARVLECSTAKVSRMENGLGPAKNVEVRALLELYGATDEKTVARFDGWATRTKTAGWWEEDGYSVDDETDRFVAVETESSFLQLYCTPVLPTLLQTPAYALAHVRERNPQLGIPEARQLADLRLARQGELLSSESPLKLVAVVDESALLRPVGGSHVLAEQLVWLGALLDRFAEEGRDDVALHVFPHRAGTPDRALSPFVLFTPREADLDPVTALVEDTISTRWYESRDDVAQLSTLFDRLLAQSLSHDESRTLLSTVK